MRLQDMNLPPPRRNGISLGGAAAQFNKAGEGVITLDNGVTYTKSDEEWLCSDGTTADPATAVNMNEFFESKRRLIVRSLRVA